MRNKFHTKNVVKQCYVRECWGARLVEEFGAHPNPDWQLFVRLICIDKNTWVFHFTYGHFWPTPIPLLTNTPSSRSLNPLLSVSLSGLSALLPIPFYLLRVHINTLLIWWDGIVTINWLKVNGCFFWRSLTINFLRVSEKIFKIILLENVLFLNIIFCQFSRHGCCRCGRGHVLRPCRGFQQPHPPPGVNIIKLFSSVSCECSW